MPAGCSTWRELALVDFLLAAGQPAKRQRCRHELQHAPAVHRRLGNACERRKLLMEQGEEGRRLRQLVEAAPVARTLLLRELRAQHREIERR